MLKHASAIEIVLWAGAVAVLLVVISNLRRVRRDYRNLRQAQAIAHPDLLSPHASLAAARGALSRKRHDLAMAIVFVSLTTLSLNLAPPPPGGFWNVRIGNLIMAIGLVIIGSASRSALRTFSQVEAGIRDDDTNRRRFTDAATRLGR